MVKKDSRTANVDVSTKCPFKRASEDNEQKKDHSDPHHVPKPNVVNLSAKKEDQFDEDDKDENEDDELERQLKQMEEIALQHSVSEKVRRKTLACIEEVGGQNFHLPKFKSDDRPKAFSLKKHPSTLSV